MQGAQWPVSITHTQTLHSAIHHRPPTLTTPPSQHTTRPPSLTRTRPRHLFLTTFDSSTYTLDHCTTHHAPLAAHHPLTQQPHRVAAQVHVHALITTTHPPASDPPIDRRITALRSSSVLPFPIHTASSSSLHHSCRHSRSDSQLLSHSPVAWNHHLVSLT